MNNLKPHVFLDFDGLKYYTFPAFARYYNQRYGLNIQPEEFHTEKDAHRLVSKYITISEPDLYRACGKEFLASIDWHSAVEPYEGMCEVVKKFSRTHIFHTVTARQSSGVNTIRYLNEKFVPGCISHIHCVWEELSDGTFKHVSKIDYMLMHCSSLGVFIDDTPNEVIKAQPHVKSILFDPHDVFGYLPEIEHRATSWKMIGEML